MSILSTLVDEIAEFWASLWLHPVYGKLDQDEYEEYEFLGECMEWRRLTKVEEERFNELHNKRGLKE
jgi:hypothetical protein